MRACVPKCAFVEWERREGHVNLLNVFDIHRKRRRSHDLRTALCSLSSPATPYGWGKNNKTFNPPDSKIIEVKQNENGWLLRLYSKCHLLVWRRQNDAFAHTGRDDIQDGGTLVENVYRRMYTNTLDKYQKSIPKIPNQRAHMFGRQRRKNMKMAILFQWWVLVQNFMVAFFCFFIPIKH